MSRAFMMVGTFAILLSSQATAQTTASAPVHLDIDASGTKQIVVRAISGRLEIAGRAAFDRVKVDGERRVSNSSFLDRNKVSLTRSGDTVFVVGISSQELDSLGESASADIVVTVPGAVPIDVADCTHEVVVHDTGPLEVHNGSGTATIERIHGVVQVGGRSGRLAIVDVHGDVAVSKSSGTTEIRGVVGDVDLTAGGSGHVTLANVSGSVRLRGAKRTGSVAIDEVGGDLIVDTATRTRLSYRRIRGQVLTP